MSTSHTDSGAGESSGSLRGSVISSACQSCKKKKTKCDGGPAPCTPCRRSKAECMFAPELDQRRRSAKRTRAEEAQFVKRLVNGLIETIRNSNDDHIQELIYTIRRNASLQEIMKSIEGRSSTMNSSPGLGSSASPPVHQLKSDAQQIENVLQSAGGPRSLDHMSFKPHSQTDKVRSYPSSVRFDGKRAVDDRSRPMRIEELVDPNPLYELSAHPWTSQSISDTLFSHLISFFLTWWAPFWNILVEDAFVAAIRSRDLKNPLCSSLLVNAILSVASQLSNSDTFYTQPNGPRTRGDNFYNEALRLWEREGFQPSLTNLQALFILWTDSNLRGKDKVGWSLLEHITAMHNALGLSSARPSFLTANVFALDAMASEQIRQSFKLIAWANYNITSAMPLVVLKRISLDAPQFGLPYTIEQVAETRPWCPYPRRTSIMIPQNAVTNACCDLAIRCGTFSRSIFREDGSLATNVPRSELAPLMNQLEQWHNTLPANLKHNSSSPPLVTELNAMYYMIMIPIYELTTRVCTASNECYERHFIDRETRSSTVTLVQELVPILTEHQNSYGYTATTPQSAIQAAVVACYTLLRLGLVDSQENQQLFSACCECMTTIGMHYDLWRGTVLMLQSTAVDLGIELPLEEHTRLTEFEQSLQPQRPLDGMYPRPDFAADPYDSEDISLEV